MHALKPNLITETIGFTKTVVALTEVEYKFFEFEKTWLARTITKIQSAVVGADLALAVNGILSIGGATGFAKVTAFLKGFALGTSGWTGIILLAASAAIVGGAKPLAELFYKCLKGKAVKELKELLYSLKAGALDLEARMVIALENEGEVSSGELSGIQEVLTAMSGDFKSVSDLDFGGLVSTQENCHTLLTKYRLVQNR